jgi:hypothetical protein
MLHPSAGPIWRSLGLASGTAIALVGGLVLAVLLASFLGLVLFVRRSRRHQAFGGVDTGGPVERPPDLYPPFHRKRALLVVLTTLFILGLVIFATIWYDLPPMLSATILTGVFVAGLFLVWPPRTGWRRPLITTLVFVAIGGAAFAWLDHTHPA